MQELLQQIDLDFYRSARLLIVRAEIEHLRQRSSASADVEGRSKIPLSGTSSSGENSSHGCQPINDLIDTHARPDAAVGARS
jgi:hypothetical protein